MASSRNQLLNIVEAAATFLVVFIHFPFPGRIGTVVTAIARGSVPFFFCVSGYFFCKEDPDKEKASIPRKIKRLLVLILLSELTYILFYCALQIRASGFSFESVVTAIMAQLNGYYLANPIIYVSVFMPPFNSVCWFVGSLIAIYALIYMFGKMLSLRASILLVFAGLLLRRVLYYAGVHTEFPYERILPVLPLPFFMIGYHIRRCRRYFDAVSDKAYGAAILSGILLTVVEAFMGGHILYLGTVVLVCAVISFCAKHSKYIPQNWLGQLMSHIGGQTATYIYTLHMLWEMLFA